MGIASQEVNSLLHVLEATTNTVPSSTNLSELVDVSLYDHAKTTAGLALCIYDYFLSLIHIFTVASLRAGGAASHPLYGLDMPDDFYEGLLDAGGLLRSCTLAGTKAFVAGGEGRLSAVDLIEWIVSQNEGIERADLPRLLANDLGITCPAPLLTTTIYNSDVYYDDIGDAYYSSMEAWKKEARNELA